MDNRKTVLLRKVRGGEAAQEKEHKGGAKAFLRKVFGSRYVTARGPCARLAFVPGGGVGQGHSMPPE